MWFRKRENDIEMEGVRVQKKEESEGEIETDYRPINWKKVFLSPKYIRKEKDTLTRCTF